MEVLNVWYLESWIWFLNSKRKGADIRTRGDGMNNRTNGWRVKGIAEWKHVATCDLLAMRSPSNHVADETITFPAQAPPKHNHGF